VPLPATLGVDRRDDQHDLRLQTARDLYRDQRLAGTDDRADDACVRRLIEKRLDVSLLERMKCEHVDTP
jgi:hypothetical protein